jgi:hypothetical protein
MQAPSFRYEMKVPSRNKIRVPEAGRTLPDVEGITAALDRSRSDSPVTKLLRFRRAGYAQKYLGIAAFCDPAGVSETRNMRPASGASPLKRETVQWETGKRPKLREVNRAR